MALKPDVSLGMALGVAALVYGIYQTHVGSVGAVRMEQPNNANVDALRKQATWTSVAIVAGISLLAKSPDVLLVGGTLVVVMDFTTRHADAVHPQTGQMINPVTGTALNGTSANGHFAVATADEISS